jgi:trans-aconitate 2-methyltransferase
MLPRAKDMPSWDPSQYSKFERERLHPALDLLNRVKIEGLQDPSIIYDLGCGPGNVTAIISEEWSSGEIYGIDSSESMLERAQVSYPHINWQKGDLNNWSPKTEHNGSIDLIFSNATYHWLDDHERLFPQLIGSLRDGGYLAIQMPNNFAQPSHTLLRQIARDGDWSVDISNAGREFPHFSAERYYKMLADQCTSLIIWETIYYHILDARYMSYHPVAEWLKGSGARPILDKLGDNEKDKYLTMYSQELEQHYPSTEDRKVLFPFHRGFIVCTK